MSGTIRVCHVVNSVGETSVPADIAVGVTRYTDVQADILAWFNISEFDNDDIINVFCVNAPDTTLGVNRETYREAREILSEYDIVQTHHNHSGTFGKIIAKRSGTPIVSTEQNNHVGFTFKGRLANGITNMWADRVTCVSKSVYKSFRWWEKVLIDDGKVRVIHNGVDLDRIKESGRIDWSIREELGVNADTFLVGTAGMLIEQKAHDVLVSAISRANQRTDNSIELVIAGDGEKRDELERLAEEENVEDSMHFLGLIDRQKVYRMIRDCDIYAMPSRWEGFSAAAVEAMALGAPCIFSDIGEFKHSYEGAALFHAVDDTEGLADRIVELLEDTDKREEFSKKAEERARKYSTENIAKEYVELYEEVLANR